MPGTEATYTVKWVGERHQHEVAAELNRLDRDLSAAVARVRQLESANEALMYARDEAERAGALALSREAKLREAWQAYLSAQETIDRAGYCDNYTDAARARTTQAKAIEEARAALSATPSPAPPTKRCGCSVGTLPEHYGGVLGPDNQVYSDADPGL